MNRLFSICLCAILPLNALALATDKQKPLTITADHVTYFQKTGKGIYQGHVKIVQGATTLWADTVSITLDAKRQLKTAIATGKPARYRTLPQVGSQVVNGSADTLTYLPTTGIIYMQQNALVKQGNNIVKGPTIRYALNQQVVSLPKTQQGRTKLTLQAK